LNSGGLDTQKPLLDHLPRLFSTPFY